VLTVAGSSWGQGEAPADETKQDAGALFERGVDDMMAGRFETGCPALARSYELDPVAGALFALAECEAKWGKFATALKHYKQYLGKYLKMDHERRQRHGKRQKLAKAQIEALETQVPTLVVELPRGAPEGTTMSLDGSPVSVTELGSPLPVDPGEHRVVAALPNGETLEQRIVVDVAQQKRTSLELKQSEPAGPPPVELPADEASGVAPMRIAAYAAGGVGVAGLIVGGITGGLMLGEGSTVDDNCVGAQCNSEGFEASQNVNVKALGTVSTIGFVVGLAGVGAGVTLFVLSMDDGEEPQEAARLVVTPAAGGSAIGLHGRW
jgi:hypothetical protein